ncbi:MAG TPA: ADP-ribosylation factor-like protein [Terriglobia bacterium]|nr:ADP-ribosylation factor-like protein [Terriglobia bacterium]
MSFVNKALCEINCKIVYYGAGLGGKTTNLQWIFEQTARGTGEKMLSLATENDRTLFFDFLPLDLGTLRGFKVRLHLYTVPGQISYQASRKLILRGVDGVVFVADSLSSRMEANLAAIEDLQQNLKELGEDFRKLPYVLQINKRDLAGAVSTSQMTSLLARKDEPVFEAIASQGVGVLDTLKSIGRQVLARMKKS